MNLQPIIKQKRNKNTDEQWTALYCRLSCEDGDTEGDSNSIKNQKMLLKKYADENHFRNVRYYVDDGFSGSNFERPDFKRMIADIEDSYISTVIVKDMSRFGRDHILVGYYTKYYLPEADVRFIAIYDQVDSETNPDDDVTPFKNILNEMYAKDCSKKIKAVVRAKGNAGKHICSKPPIGYVKSPDDKEKWVVEKDGAEIVKEIFKLCVNGYGPSQIARILSEHGVDTPTIYCQKHGLPHTTKVGVDYDLWSTETVVHILENECYLGHTVNFKSYKKSYKSKRRIDSPKQEWKIFENTQEPIIDQETFEIVQKIRQGKRRPTDMGEMSVLSGMLYCADCGKKMYLCRCTTMKQKEYFNCSTYRKDKKKNCTSHQIMVDAVTAMIKDDLKYTIHFATENKEQFLQILKQHSDAKTKREIQSATREVEEGQKRTIALDKIIQSLYEDKVEGKISEERYQKMSDTYETEQRELTAKVAALKAEIDASKSQMDDISKFVALVNKYADFEELTPDILRAFIDKVIIYEKTKVDGHYRHTIEIVYNFVGAVDIPDFDEIDRKMYEEP